MITFDVDAAYFFLGNLQFVVFGSAEVHPWIAPEAETTFTAVAMNHRESVCSGHFHCCALWVTGALENWVSRGFTSSQILQSQGIFSVKESCSLLSNPRPLPSSVDKLNTYHKDDLYSLARINEPFKNI